MSRGKRKWLQVGAGVGPLSLLPPQSEPLQLWASGAPLLTQGAAPLSQAPQSREKTVLADDGEARMPKDRKSLGFTHIPANQQARGSSVQPQRPHIGLVHQASPGTSEFHQVKLPTLHSTRMLMDSRALGMHVLCVFRIRGQGRLTSSDLGGKVYAAVLCSFKCLFNLIWTMLVSSVSPVPFFFSVPPASKKEWRRSAFQCSPRCLLFCQSVWLRGKGSTVPAGA